MRARFLVILATLVLFPALAAAAGPEGWFLAGNDPSSYTADRNSVVTHAGKPSACLASIRKSRGFGTMMQCIDPADYAGKRIRFSGYVKARDVRSWAGLWMRVDGPDTSSGSLAFDNMQSRPIKGTRDWTRYDVVLDVAKEATGICLGILLDGEGKVWLSGVSFEAVSTATPTTGTHTQRERKPANLDFER
jgi:hypothetical protein